MIRSTKLILNKSNQSKLDTLDSLFSESKKVVNLFIDSIWSKGDFNSKYVDFKVDTWLSARLQQCLGKQALEIVKSQRKRKKKTKPIFSANVLNLDSRFVDFKFDLNSFDCWIKLGSLGNKINLKLPTRKHKHFNKFQDWNLKNSIRLRKQDNKYITDVYFEKSVQPKSEGKSLGLDCGYRKLLIDSNNQIYDIGLEKIYDKINNKKQGSKAFKRALVERNNKINESVNLINFSNLKSIIVEDLKNVKHKSKGKINKKFNSKLQRWSYSKVLDKLSNTCEEQGIQFTKVNPSYTSQTCSCCGFKHKDNRKGEDFLCLGCGLIIDADYNAAVNILHRGTYSSSTN